MYVGEILRPDLMYEIQKITLTVVADWHTFPDDCDIRWEGWNLICISSLTKNLLLLGQIETCICDFKKSASSL